MYGLKLVYYEGSVTKEPFCVWAITEHYIIGIPHLESAGHMTQHSHNNQRDCLHEGVFDGCSRVLLTQLTNIGYADALLLSTLKAPRGDLYI